MHQRHKKKRSVLQWFPFVCAGILIALAFLVAPLLLLPPPPRYPARASRAFVPGEALGAAQGRPTAVPVPTGEVPATERSEQSSPAGATPSKPKRIPTKAAAATSQVDGSADAQVRWTR
jgi:hypothetical protein